MSDADKSTPPSVPTPPSVDSVSEERCDPRVLELLVCPVTKSTLTYDPVRQELISRSARLAFPIRRGVPHMLPAEARHLDDPLPPTGRKP